MCAACVIMMTKSFLFLLLLMPVANGFLTCTASFAAIEKEGQVDFEVVAILDTDEIGEKLRYPSSVTYDDEMDEIYVVGGGDGKVIVYSSNFFPIVSLGKGRSGDSPRGVHIDKSSNIYLCQSNSADTPPRITRFNPAFFPEEQIFLSSMPEAENFIPQKMIIGLTGNMYVTGLNTRGVLVLDNEGKFSHWLKPKDIVFTENSGKRDDEVELPTELAGWQNVDQIEKEQEEDIMDMRDLLPPGLLPSVQEEGTIAINQELQPVQIADVTTDSSGHLYILSEETSKIYVYTQSEEFLFSFGQKGGSTGKMSRPKGLVVDEKKKALYVVDYMRHTVLIFDLGGKFMHEFGGLGAGPGWFQYPTALALNKKGNLIVADLFNQRVQILDIRFEYSFPTSLAPQKDQSPVIPDEEEPVVPELEEQEEGIFLPEPIYL